VRVGFWWKCHFFGSVTVADESATHDTACNGWKKDGLGQCIENISNMWTIATITSWFSAIPLPAPMSCGQPTVSAPAHQSYLCMSRPGKMSHEYALVKETAN
jgi:hypothetical protein